MKKHVCIVCGKYAENEVHYESSDRVDMPFGECKSSRRVSLGWICNKDAEEFQHFMNAEIPVEQAKMRDRLVAKFKRERG